MEFKLPEIGEGVHEGELIRWLVKEGDSVAADQPLLEVMTDKATVEVPSPSAGVIRGINTKDGQMIKVGQLLATIEGGASAAQSPASQSVAQSPASQSVAHSPSSQTTAPSTKAAPQQATAPVPPTPIATNIPSAASVSPSQGASFSASLSRPATYVSATDALSSASVPAAPVVRAMAAKMGVDLNQVPATGPQVGGRARVLEQDLLQFLSQGSPSISAIGSPPAVSQTSSNVVERRPVRGLRRVIAQAMVKSKYTAPHYSYVDEFECSELVMLREQAKLLGERQGVKITYLPFIVKALVGALKEFPECNSSLEENPNGMELVIKKNYHIGFAVATQDGLLVPVIKNADKKSLVEIAREMTVLSDKVRAGKASPDELKGSTFSITSMGNIGGLFATPIINYPEVGILGVYKVQEKPVVKNGQIVVGKTMHLSLSLDHRVVDGAVGGAFCNAIIERLANPARLLMELV